MEFMLVVVAAVSLALAAIMSTVAWRLLRDTKVRTRNRAEALVALLHAGEKPAPKPAPDPTWTPATAVKMPSTGDLDQHALPDEPGEPIANARQGEHSTPVAARLPLTDSESDSALAAEPVTPRAIPGAEPQPAASSKTDVRSKAGARPSSPIADAPLRSAPIRRMEDESAIDAWDSADVGRGLNRTSAVEPSLADAMFASDEPRQMSIGRWVGLASAALVILIGAGTVYALNSGTWLSSVTGSWDRTSRAAASAQQPLELLSLGHARTRAARSWSRASSRTRPTVRRLQRRRRRQSICSTRRAVSSRTDAPALDVASLGPGDESPFVVKVPHDRERRAGTASASVSRTAASSPTSIGVARLLPARWRTRPIDSGAPVVTPVGPRRVGRMNAWP